MNTYTLEEAKIVLNAEKIKEKQKKRVALRKIIKERAYGIILILLALIDVLWIEPMYIGADPAYGGYDYTSAWCLLCLGFFAFLCPIFFKKKEEL